MALLITRQARARLALPPAGIAGGYGVDLSDPVAARAVAAPLAGEGLGGATLAALDRLATAFEALVDRYLAEAGGGVFLSALDRLDHDLGRDAVDGLLAGLAEAFELPRGSGEGEGAGGQAPRSEAERLRVSRLRSLLLFWWLDVNPAAAPAIELLFAGEFRRRPLLAPALSILRSELSRAVDGPRWTGGLISLLLEPVQRAPTSLASQLRLAVEVWSGLLPEGGEALLRGADLVDEETPRLPPGVGPPPPIEQPSYMDLGEVRRFTSDREWMPRMVLVAKNARVWLHQLSLRHGRAIDRLDEIPQSELEALADLGVSGLWLIGIWERSPASARIKRLAGNPEALGSAYSLLRYRIADKLGGDDALQGLSALAGRCGLRLAADMVPNHFAIDSDWVLERPEWFVGSEICPFPNYRFEGPELSPRPEISLKIEDGYWDRSDAAVVFRREELASGSTRYIYHGNDGTSTPWNDTAQLDFLRPDVREAVTAQIMEVARRFPVVRFDAAMTLARRHFQRLWYPPPGEGGDIPSRAERGLSAAAFDAAMPEEFWRAVVDRAAEEAPDTLLLAEAFWLMEGYFVRILGMHRVYNSAFMNLLRNGETGRFRRLIAETLAFDPQVLERYVNFMSNPDERTAEEQFGRGDRYFGVCGLMATLPGLPMFGHGQIEGLRERYGMEYGRAYVDEAPDSGMVERHRREIAPLLADRTRFAGAKGFSLYEFRGAHGEVVESVLAYSQIDEAGEVVVVVFNHGDTEVRGRLFECVPTRRSPGAEPRRDRVASLLGLPVEGLLRLHDSRSGLFYLARGEEIAQGGIEVHLAPFELRVLSEFAPAEEGFEGVAGERLDALAEDLGLSGVPDLRRALQELELAPVREALGRVVGAEVVRRLALPGRSLPDDEALDRLEETLLELARGVARYVGRPLAPGLLGHGFDARARGLLLIPVAARALALSPSADRREAGERAVRLLDTEVLAGLAWRLGVEAVERGFQGLSVADPVAEWELDRAPVPTLAGLARRRGWGAAAYLPVSGAGRGILERWLAEPAEMGEALGRHVFEGTIYVRREAVERAAGVRLAAEVLAWSDRTTRQLMNALAAWSRAAGEILVAAEETGYRAEP
jgi:hypothetical protein